jgi:broad specificity phosphatase PhoE
MLFIQTLLATTVLLAPIEVPLDTLSQLEITTSKSTYIYLVRHGESIFNRPNAEGVRLVSGRSLSIPLTAKGEKQATALGAKLVEKLPKNAPIAILSSTALRAQQTADRLVKELMFKDCVERGSSYENLSEVSHGRFEGKPKDVAYDNAMKHWESLSAKEKFSFSTIDHGESYQEAAMRALPVLQQIVSRYPNKTLFVTTHKGTMNAIAIQLSGSLHELSQEPFTPLPTLHIENCDILLIELPEGKTIDQAKVKMHIKSGV